MNAEQRPISEIRRAFDDVKVGDDAHDAPLRDAIDELEALRAENARLREALERVTAVSPTAISTVEDCDYCYHGTVNIGTAIDPEPGPCPRCYCELHREAHEDCFAVGRQALGKRKHALSVPLSSQRSSEQDH